MLMGAFTEVVALPLFSGDEMQPMVTTTTAARRAMNMNFLKYDHLYRLCPLYGE
jgi:hypothetical protein